MNASEPQCRAAAFNEVATLTAVGGLWIWGASLSPALACQRILAAQRVYGGHGDAISDLGPIAIGRSLFEKVPNDKFDRGPVSGGGGRWHMTGSIRIDNRAEIAAALCIDASALVTLSDCHLAMRAWERWQEACLPRLYGDFALVVWDAREAHLVLARDPLGGFPLHYHMGSGFLAFSSMPKGLHALPDIPRGPDAQRLAEDLALLPHVGTRSYFVGIDRVEPAHFVRIKRGQVHASRYWTAQAPSQTRWRFDDAVAAVRAELDRAVAARLRGAGEIVGAHLSGGLDSAAVTSTAARTFAGSVVAFTAVPGVGYESAPSPRRVDDEGDLAALTAVRYANIEHVRVPNPTDAVTCDWDRDTHLLDQPVINPCNARWLNAVRGAARDRGISVMLTGQAGNMTLTYNGLELLPELVGAGRLLQLARDGAALVRSGLMTPKGVLANGFGPWVPMPLWRYLNRGRAGAGFAGSAVSALNPARAKLMDIPYLYRASGMDPAYRPSTSAFEARLRAMQFGDRGNKRMATLGAFGVDERDPTADRSLLELCLSLPTNLFLRNGEQRTLAKAALRGHVPDTVLDDRRRGYQAADWYKGVAAARSELQSELRHLAHNPAVAGLVDLERFENLLADWPKDGWQTDAVTFSYRYTLLRGCSVARFTQRASGAN